MILSSLTSLLMWFNYLQVWCTASQKYCQVIGCTEANAFFFLRSKAWRDKEKLRGNITEFPFTVIMEWGIPSVITRKTRGPMRLYCFLFGKIPSSNTLISIPYLFPKSKVLLSIYMTIIFLLPQSALNDLILYSVTIK